MRLSESSSTWGDLYRHFDSQGFEKLPEEMRVQLDGIPLERTDYRWNGPTADWWKHLSLLRHICIRKTDQKLPWTEGNS